MNTILVLFPTVLVIAIALAAYFLTIGALFPSRLSRTQRIINQSRARAFWIGLVNFLFFGVIALVLYVVGEQAEGGGRFLTLIPALLITGMLVFILGLGLTGVANLVGERVFPAQSQWKQTSLGAVVLVLACALPLAGWFILFPYAGLMGFGAVILSLFQRES